METGESKSKLIESFVNAINKYINIIELNRKAHIKSFDNAFRWYRTNDFGFRLCNKYLIKTDPSMISELSDCWKELLILSNDYKPFSDILNNGIYPETGIRGKFPIAEYFMSFIPDFISYSAGDLFFDRNHDTHQVISEFMDGIERKEIENITLIPVLDIRTNSKINIAEDIEFREFTPKEKERILNTGLISIPVFHGELTQEFSDWQGLVIRSKTKLYHKSDDIPNLGEYHKREDKINKMVDNFLISSIFAFRDKKMLSLVNSRQPRISYENTISSGVSYINDQKSNQFRSGFRETKHEIDGTQEAVVRNIFYFLSDEGKSRHNEIKLAMKRIYYSKTRLDQQDRLLDLMIASELLYNSNAKNELTLTISLNAALHSDEKNKESVYKDFKDAYAARSDIVHGNMKKTHRFEELSDSVEKHLINAILKMMIEIKNETYQKNPERIPQMLSTLSSTDESIPAISSDA